MGKRNSCNKIEYYQAKIRRLQENENRRRRRVVIYSDSSQSEEHSDIENPTNENGSNEISGYATTSHHEEAPPAADHNSQPSDSEPPPLVQDALVVEEQVPKLDADFLSALGDTADEVPAYGEKIHQDLAQRWQPILCRGLVKEVKEKLLKEYAIPENCKLLRSPSLNPEIAAAITDATRARDKKLETAQQQLGLGITTINRAMSTLFNGDDKQTKVQVIKMLSDGCRILSDLHYAETQSRVKLITPSLDKTFINIVQDVERDEFLFGSKLSEKIKASKTIEKQGLQIKKVVTTQKASAASTPQSTTRPRNQGNWTAPSRYYQPSNRGGRGRAQKNAPTNTYRSTVAQSKTPGQAKQRVPTRK